MLIQTEVGRAEVVAKQVAALPGVLSSEYVTGPYDVVVRVGSETLTDLAGQCRRQRAGHRGHHPDADLPDRLPEQVTSNPNMTVRRGPC